MKAVVCGALVLSAVFFWQSKAGADCSRRYFVFGEQAVVFGDRVEIGRGPVAAGQTAELGVNTRMQGDLAAPAITLRNDAVLNGTAFSAGPVNLSPGAKILIRTLPLGPEHDCEPPGVPTITPGTGSELIDEPFELPPGQYGNLTVGVGATLAVTTGEYHFESLTFEPDTRLVIVWQGGPARLLANGFVMFGDRHEQMVIGGGGKVSVGAEIVSRQTTQLRLGTDATILSRIVAPYAEVNVPSRTTVRAPLYGKVVRVEPDSIIGKPYTAPTACE